MGSLQQNGVDKDHLYGDFRKRQAWQDDLYRKTAHKAVDIPCDDMGINVTNNTGIGAKGIAAVAALAGLPALGLAAALFMGGGKSEPAVASPAPPAKTTTITKESNQVLEIGQPQVVDPPKQ